jgi:hypothetical protein
LEVSGAHGHPAALGRMKTATGNSGPPKIE